MYRILLVDDEPIILSGLQSMLRWEDYGCTVVGGARNGEQALAQISEYNPDIVICDINMPILSGLEVLGRCAQEFPEVVFIMLTNHEDFDMAREALRNQAVDYLLKIDLDEQKLARSVLLAIEERVKRGKLAQTGVSREKVSPTDMIKKYVSDLLGGGDEDEDPELAAVGLEKRGAADRVLSVELVMDPSRIPNIAVFTAQERERLFTFHHKLTEDLVQKMFYNTGHVFIPRGENAWLYLWNLESFELVNRFQAKLISTLGEISQMEISLLASEIVPRERLGELRIQLVALRGEFSICPRSIIQYSQFMMRTNYVEAAKRYVESHILGRVSMQDVATAIGITPNYLSSLFKRQLGQNFIDYVNASKIKYACTLLRSGQHLVYEVSHMLGYDNAYYFSKVFKRYMNITPTEYQALSTQKGPQR